MRSLLREPLIQFLLVGAALFGAYALVNRSAEPRPDCIVVSAGQIEHLAAVFGRFQQRPPTPEELASLVDDFVREEMLSREAVALGLDQDDSVIRRRLRQKLEFVASDLGLAEEPSEREMQAWLSSHSDAYTLQARFTFLHVFLDPTVRGERLAGEAAAMIADLTRSGPLADASSMGDPFLLPLRFADEPLSAIATTFGSDFAQHLIAMKVGEWSGPVPSGLGSHLVLVTERTEATMPALDEVREAVKRDILHERSREGGRRLMERVRAKYDVKIEWPSAAASNPGAESGGP